MEQSDAAEYRRVMSRILSGVSFWFDPETYKKLPILMPYAVRDNDARQKGRATKKEAWGSPDSSGFSRDDNSWVKNMAKSGTVKSVNGLVADGAKLGGGYTACHLWRNDKTGESAVKSPHLYSFVPNIVYLPQSLGVLTDHEGSFAQRYMQRLSRRIYGKLKVGAELRPFVDEAWAQLPPPEDDGTELLADVNLLCCSDSILRKKLQSTEEVAAALRTRAKGGKVEGKVLTKRYAPGLKDVHKTTASKTAAFLETYLAAARKFVK